MKLLPFPLIDWPSTVGAILGHVTTLIRKWRMSGSGESITDHIKTGRDMKEVFNQLQKAKRASMEMDHPIQLSVSKFNLWMLTRPSHWVIHWLSKGSLREPTWLASMQPVSILRMCQPNRDHKSDMHQSKVKDFKTTTLCKWLIPVHYRHKTNCQEIKGMTLHATWPRDKRKLKQSVSQHCFRDSISVS